MRVKNHRVEGIPYRAARSIGGQITPEIVILHDTAGRLTPGNSAAYLRDNPAGVSVHFVIERDGAIEQQVPTNRRAGHAGQSMFHGRRDCNAFSVGIEIINPGRMTWANRDARIARAWFGQTFGDTLGGGVDLAEITTPQHGTGVWMAYTEAQLDALDRLLAALFAGVPTLKDITTHWYVSPGRKVDTNPLFPLEHLRARILGRDDPAERAAEAQSEPVPTATMLRIKAQSGLNMRRWPSFNPNVIRAIPQGTVVPVIRSGVIDGRAWSLVLFDGQEGWIVDAYTQLA
ncbi:N-acetylmuramoyl-L-alanine amidase [Paracoccus sp. (in: a-proteobacteria)]|uniref:N-acetylmuramoyl-L-alanine amidase n=1 Tax=Paracoccus sp. TaxID=267 RepID=UPI00272B4876|nr:N-acetylmuramoyl-L-alanine amidase [Paracoccus sp. (in: a-proteobacteria)]